MKVDFSSSRCGFRGGLRGQAQTGCDSAGGVHVTGAVVSIASASCGVYCTRDSRFPFASASGGSHPTRTCGVSFAIACGEYFAPAPAVFPQRRFAVIEDLVKVIKILSRIRVQRRFLDQNMDTELFGGYAQVEDLLEVFRALSQDRVQQLVMRWWSSSGEEAGG